jgi:putative peptide maturation system protein
MSTDAFASVLGEALAYLTALNAERTDPAEAQRRLRELRGHHPAARLRLVWQREEYDGSLHYDLLISRAGKGTVSLSHCPDRALPWAFRGGHRVGERLLLRVNGADMEVDQAIACLDFLWDDLPLAERLVTACLLRQELAQDPVELSEVELQHAMDAFRRARGLLTAAATTEWMARRCLSHRDLETLVAGEAAVAQLRKRITANHIQGYFDAHRGELDVVRLARLVFAGRADAQRAVLEMHAGDDFYAVAERAFATGIASTPSSFFLTVRRDDLPAEIGERIVDLTADMTIGPCSTDGGHAVLRLLGVEPAVLDDSTIDVIERRLFAAWLEDRRRLARVEWFWGNVARTAAESTTQARTP